MKENSYRSLHNVFTQALRHEQGVVQGQIFKAEYSCQLEFSFPSPRLVALPRLRTQSTHLFTHTWEQKKKKKRIHAFPKEIYVKWNANSLLWDLNQVADYITKFTINGKCRYRFNLRCERFTKTIWWGDTEKFSDQPRGEWFFFLFLNWVFFEKIKEIRNNVPKVKNF